MMGLCLVCVMVTHCFDTRTTIKITAALLYNGFAVLRIEEVGILQDNIHF
jgi:hypothetical protein